jgi:hypothetical protein
MVVKGPILNMCLTTIYSYLFINDLCNDDVINLGLHLFVTFLSSHHDNFKDCVFGYVTSCNQVQVSCCYRH